MSLRSEFAFYVGDKPTYQAVYEILRDAIVTGRIAKGERLLEVYYSQLFNVSRTPVRAAFRKLENNGLVVMLPNGGVEAKGLDLLGIENVFKFQQALERLAFPQVINNITDEDIEDLLKKLDTCEELIDQDIQKAGYINEDVHKTLFRISRFEGIMEAVDLAYGFAQGYNILAARDRARQCAITTEHRSIIEALKTRNNTLLSSAADYHLEACKLYAIQYYHHFLAQNKQH